MKEIYRIKKGKITNENQIIPFDFGLTFEDNGVLFFDFYISESFDINTYAESQARISFQENFTMTAYTDENNDIEVTELFIRNIIPHQSLIKMQSHGYLKHIKARDMFFEETEEDVIENKRYPLYYLEFEGLKMQYSDLTETIKSRRGVPVKNFNNLKRDHTTALLLYDSPLNIGCNNFHFTFFKSENEENIFVKLPHYRDSGKNLLYYDTYNEIKRDLIFILSLLNGAEVGVRKEFTGGYYTEDKVSSQITTTYSFSKIKNESYNSYIPLNNPIYRSDNILSSVFLNCFNKYVTENKKFDLNSIIFYLNCVEQAKSIDEKVFILIITLERLAQKFIESITDSDVFILSDDNYEPLKLELLKICDKYSSDKNNKIAIDKLKGKIGELNKIKKTSTKYKFLKLLEYANILVTPDIEKIIEEVRHRTIHHGEVGAGNQGVINYLVLDELIRDIILNIIGYKCNRLSRVNLNKQVYEKFDD